MRKSTENGFCELCGTKLPERRRFWMRFCNAECRTAKYWEKRKDKIQSAALKEANKAMVKQ